MGKLTRICATVSTPSFASSHPRKNANAPFLVLGGFADFILPSTYANGHGAIIGLGNVAPVSIRFSFQRSPPTVPSNPLYLCHLTNAHLITLSSLARSSSTSPRRRFTTPLSSPRHSAYKALSHGETSPLPRPPSQAPSTCYRSCTDTAETRAGRSRPSPLLRPRSCGHTPTSRNSSPSSASLAARRPHRLETPERTEGVDALQPGFTRLTIAYMMCAVVLLFELSLYSMLASMAVVWSRQRPEVCRGPSYGAWYEPYRILLSCFHPIPAVKMVPDILVGPSSLSQSINK